MADHEGLGFMLLPSKYFCLWNFLKNEKKKRKKKTKDKRLGCMDWMWFLDVHMLNEWEAAFMLRRDIVVNNLWIMNIKKENCKYNPWFSLARSFCVFVRYRPVDPGFMNNRDPWVDYGFKYKPELSAIHFRLDKYKMKFLAQLIFAMEIKVTKSWLSTSN